MGHSVVPNFNLGLILDGRRLSEHEMKGLSPRLRKKLQTQVARALTLNKGAVWERLGLREGGKIASVTLATTSEGKILLCAGEKWLEIKNLSKFTEKEEAFLKTLDKVQKEAWAKGIGGSGKYRVVTNEARSETFLITAEKVREAEKKNPYKLTGRIGSRVSKNISSIVQGLAGCIDACAVVRNGLVIGGLGTSVAAGVMGVVPGIGLSALGGIGIWQSWEEGGKAIVNHDEEGRNLAALDWAQNVYLTAIGPLLALSFAPNLRIHVSHLAEIGQALQVIGVIYYGSVAARGFYQLVKCGSFRSTMNHLLFAEGRNKQIGDEELFKTLQWLQSQVRLSPLEEAIIQKTVKPEDQAQHREWALRKKGAKFERVTNGETLEALRQSVESDLLVRLQKGDRKAQLEARLLIHKVSQANFNKIVKAVLLVFIGILGIAAFLAMPHVAAALFIVCALLWLLAGDVNKVHEKIACLLARSIRNRIWKKSAIDVETMEAKLKQWIEEQQAILPTSLPGSASSEGSQTTQLAPTDGTLPHSSNSERVPLVAS